MTARMHPSDHFWIIEFVDKDRSLDKGWQLMISGVQKALISGWHPVDTLDLISSCWIWSKHDCFPLVEPSIIRIIRHGHPHGYPYGYPCKWFQGTDIHTDILALWAVTLISVRISVRISMTNYPYHGQFNQGQLFFKFITLWPHSTGIWSNIQV